MKKDDRVFLVRGECNGDVASNLAFVTAELCDDASQEVFSELMSDAVRGLIEERYGNGAEFKVSYRDVTEDFKLHCERALS